MLVQSDYLDLLKEKYKLKNDTEIGELLDLSKQAVSGYRCGDRNFGPDICMKIAELLDVPPEKIAADMMAARVTRDRKLREKWLKAGAVVGLMIMTALPVSEMRHQAVNMSLSKSLENINTYTFRDTHYAQ